MQTYQEEGFLPVGGSLIEYVPSQGPAVLGGPNTVDPDIPQTLDDLDSGERSTSDTIDIQTASSLQLPLFSLNGSGQRSVFIQQYSKWRDVSQLSGVLRYGIAIRWVITILRVDTKAQLTQPSLIAASVEFGYARANAVFEVIGMQSQAITKLIPAPSELTVDNYALFSQRLTEIKNKIYSAETRVRPRLLGSPREIINELVSGSR